MDPNIQLIQLMVRIERDEAAQRRLQVADSDDLVDEKMDCLPNRDNHIKRSFNLSHRRQQCGCA